MLKITDQDGFILVKRKLTKSIIHREIKSKDPNVLVFAITLPINSNEYIDGDRNFKETNRNTLLFKTILKHSNSTTGTTFESFFSNQNYDVKYFFLVDYIDDNIKKVSRTIILKQWCLHTDKRRPDGLKPFNQRFVKIIIII
jgi:hypothetical protein